MQELTVLTYKENPISFDFGNDNKLINATQMGKVFGKRPTDFLRNQNIKDYIVALSASLNCVPTDIVRVVNGGKNFGTWMNSKLALRFAQWLSPDFAVWVDMKIEELLTTGKVELQAYSNDPFIQMRMAQIDLEKKIESNSTDIHEIKSKLITRNEGYYTISGYCNLMGYKIGSADTNKLGREASKLSREKEVMIDKAPCARYGTVGSYHTSILEIIFANFQNA